MKKPIEFAVVFFMDFVTIFFIFKLSVFIRKSLSLVFHSVFPEALPSATLTHLWWIFVVWMFFFYYEGLYSRMFSYWDEIRILWKVIFLSTVGVFTITSVGKMSDEISRTVIVLMGLIAIALLPLIRMTFKKTLRRTGLLQRRVLILGAGETGRLMLKALNREPNYGYKIIGFLDDDPEKCGKMIEGLKIHRGVDKALHYINRCNIEDIFITMPGAGKDRLQGLINNLQHKVENILFVPDVFGIAVLGTSLQHFFQEEAFALELKNNLSRPVNIILKKCFDIGLCMLLLPLLLFPMIVLIVLIKLDSKGPSIFAQRRPGKDGKIFHCYKFRTMLVDAEKRMQHLFKEHPEMAAEWDQYRKLKNDPRITKVGHLLRATSLDELPQIFNVLKGEMSLVGPRPYLLGDELNFGENTVNLLTKPGITGLWQVSGRSNTSHLYRVALDSWYVRNWNLWLDIVILLKTVRIVIKREGAY